MAKATEEATATNSRPMITSLITDIFADFL